MEPATAVATGTRLHRDHLRSAQDTAQEPAKAAGQEGPVREASPGTGECVNTAPTTYILRTSLPCSSSRSDKPVLSGIPHRGFRGTRGTK